MCTEMNCATPNDACLEWLWSKSLFFGMKERNVISIFDEFAYLSAGMHFKFHSARF